MGSDMIEKNVTMRDYLRALFRRKGVIALTFILTMSFVAVGLLLKTKVYEAQVKMLILANKNVENPYYRNISDYRTSEVTMTQSEIVKSNPVVERVVRTLKLQELPLDHEKQFASPVRDIVIDIQTARLKKKLAAKAPGEAADFIFRKVVRDLKKKIKVEPIRNTDLFTITVTAYTPEDAARKANIISRSYCIFDLEQQLAELKQQYGQKHLSVIQLENNIEKLERNLDRDTVSSIEAIGPASVKIIEQATAPVEAAGKSKAVILAFGLFISLLLGCVLSFFIDYFDSTLKSPHDIQSALAMPFLGYVPRKHTVISKGLGILSAGMIIAVSFVCFAAALRIVLSALGADPANPVMRAIRFPLSDALTMIVCAVTLVITAYGSLRLFALLAQRSVRKHVMIADFRSSAPYAQAYRNLSEQIYLALKGEEHRSVLMASVLPGEGVSSILANLGSYLADIAGKHVLLIDANSKRPALHGLFGIEKNTKGLVDVLNGSVTLENALVARGDNLEILPLGSQDTHVSVLLETAKFARLIEAVERKFDIVLIDCAHIKDSKDSAAIASLVNGIILVVSEGRTKREVLDAALAALQQKKSKFIGAILNNRTFSIPGMIYKRA